MKRVTLLILTLIYAIGITVAQVSFELRAPNVVAAGERFRIEFVLTNAESQKFNPPTFTGVEILAGPVTSNGKFFNNFNGKISEGITTTFTYTVQASAAAKATISASSIVTEAGKTLTTRATQIDIGQSTSRNNTKGGATQQPFNSSSILLKMDVNKTDVYKGEAIVATLKIYTQVGIAGFEDVKIPPFNGFWKQELDMGTPRAERANLGGKMYESQVLKQWLVYPQKSGILEIEQCGITAVAQIVTQSTNSGSLFDNFFGGGSTVEHIKRNLKSAPVKVKVKELPVPQPIDFSGGVGKFSLTGTISTNQVTANSGGSIIIKLTGTGDLPLIDAPVIEFPSEFEKYDVKSSDQIENSIGGSNGSRTWEIPFIARAEGDFTIKGVNMSYFDPATGKYVSLTTGDFQIKVLKDTNPGSNLGKIVSGVTKEDIKILGQDVRYISTGKVEFHRRNSHLIWSATFWALILVIIAAFVLALVLLKQKIRNRKDVARTKNKKANSVALRRLKKAKSYMNTPSGESNFYEELLRALWGYMGDKLSIQVSDLSKARLREEFLSRGVSPENGEEFLSLIADCEMAQYSPSGSIEMSKAYNDALNLIGKLELK